MSESKGPLNPQNFIPFELRKITPYNHNASKFTFELPDNQASNIPIASCLVVKSTDVDALKDDQGDPIIRPYTPISGPDTPGELTILVKRYEAGNASRHIHSLKVGDTLSIKGPIAKFPYKINEFDEVAFIGGGTGIAPFYQVFTHALADKTNKTKFKLLFSNISEQDILLREELDALKAQHPDTFDVVYLVDNPSKDWTGPSGYITAEHIKNYVGAPETNIKIFVCGPPPQVASLAGAKDGPKQGVFGGILKDLGYSEEQVFKF